MPTRDQPRTDHRALAVALAEGQGIPEAIAFANCAAGIAVTRSGAQTSIPGRVEVEKKQS